MTSENNNITIRYKTKNPQYLFDKKGFSCVAGIGFEPMTFGL